jgi:hypothetical protein
MLLFKAVKMVQLHLHHDLIVKLANCQIDELRKVL